MRFVTFSFVLLAVICGLAAAGQVRQQRPPKHYQRKLQHRNDEGHGTSSYPAGGAIVKQHVDQTKAKFGSSYINGGGVGAGLEEKYSENVENNTEKSVQKHVKKQKDKHGKRQAETHSFEDHHEHEDHIHHDYHAHPKYKFDYGVKDAKSGDDKKHWEERDGDKVTGSYTIKEADGTTRIVEYSADHHNGFQAVVKTVHEEEEGGKEERR